MTSALVPITAAKQPGSIGADGNYQGYNGYGPVVPLGYNHRGVEEINRITMSLKSGIESEVNWALNTLTRLSAHSGINLNKMPFIGHELIKFFIKPFHYIIEKKYSSLTQENLSIGIDCLLTLRNLAQDLHNQQWLSQIKSLKKYLIEVLKFLSNWFYHSITEYELSNYTNQFFEALKYTLDLLEPLTCYYTNNTQKDPLFNILLKFSTKSNDKAILIGVIKSLSHLLINKPEPKKEIEEDTNPPTANNCIDLITQDHLQYFTNYLLINDNELNFAVLQFLKQYLFSTALHKSFTDSIKDSQKQRLFYLLQIKSSMGNLNTLLKTLPHLIVSNLPLNSPPKNLPVTSLIKRSLFSSVPSTLPELPQDLYDIIVRFPEPLRATTWLRCCYEPYNHTNTVSSTSSTSEVIPGEVTQISLWKAYERQFQEIWQPVNGKLSDKNYKPLLPAVEFIKNVTHAFPNSEAMVVNLDPVDDQPKKKFIIKGIQPRAFAVSLDIGNYEALKPTDDSSGNPSENHKLPIGHIDEEKFKHSLNSIREGIVGDGVNLKNLEFITPINTISQEIFDHIVTNVYENNQLEENLIKFYTKHWLPELIYANPLLVDSGLINGKWLKYII